MMLRFTVLTSVFLGQLATTGSAKDSSVTSSGDVVHHGLSESVDDAHSVLLLQSSMRFYQSEVRTSNLSSSLQLPSSHAHEETFSWKSVLDNEFVSDQTKRILKCRAVGDAAKGKIACTHETGWYDQDGRGSYNNGIITHYSCEQAKIDQSGTGFWIGKVMFSQNRTLISWTSANATGLVAVDTWRQLQVSSVQSAGVTLLLWSILGCLVFFLIVCMLLGFPDNPMEALEDAWEDYKAGPRNRPAAASLQDIKLSSVQHGEPIPEAAVPGGVFAMFQKQASIHPHDVALVDAESSSSLTYSELAKSVDELAKALQQQVGVQKGDVVGLLLQPSRGFVVAALAVMKAGAAWLPLDTKSPGPRLQSLLQRAGASVALAQEESTMASIAPFPTCRLSASGALLPNTLTKASRPAGRPHLPDGVAAIFYTSGSSGEPKAVMYGHETICHGALTFGKLCQADSSSIFLIKTPVIWAVCEYEVFTPLILGAKAVLSGDSQRDIAMLTRTISDHKVSILVTSAPVLQLLVGESLPSLRHAVNVGAALPIDMCKTVQKAFGTSFTLHNLYGCTETPCLQWTYDSSAVVKGRKLAPAGLPQPGAEVHIFDENLKPTPPGELGEIFIGGPYLSRGYFGDEHLTNSRFITKLGTGRLYRTGDVGCWVCDAAGRPVLQVEGRTDRQLNIKGVRVSPEEIESVLLQVSGVKEVAVVAGEGANQSIVAAIAGDGKQLKLAVEQHAKQHLPSHMCPAALLLLDSLPKLGNGKIDLLSVSKYATRSLAETLAEADVEVADSLGMMRKVKRQAAFELQVISALRGLAVVMVLIYHYWMSLEFAPWPTLQIEMHLQKWSEQGSYNFRVFMTGWCRTQWALPTLMIASAYVDSWQAPKTKWRENVTGIILLLLMGTLLPWIFRDSQSSKYQAVHRWYLEYFVICNLLHCHVFLPLRERVTKPYAAVSKVLIVLLVCRASTMLNYINVCGLGPTAEKIANYLSGEGCRLIPFTSTKSTFFGFIQTGVNMTYLFQVYTVAWWYGPDLVTWLRKSCQRVPWPFISVSAACLIFMSCMWAGDNAAYGNQFFFAPQFCFGAWQHFHGLMCALVIILGVAFGSKAAWFPMSFLDYLGRCSLGAYIIHLFITPEFLDKWFGIPPMQDILPLFGGWPGDGLLKFVVVIGWCTLYVTTVGWTCQILLIDGTMYLISLIRKLAQVAAYCLMPTSRKEQQAHERWRQLCTSCFDRGGVLCIDGGTGSEVQREAEKLGPDEAVNSEGWSCVQWKTHPQVLKGVHLSYLRSGAKLVISNSYATNRHIMKAAGYEELTRRATECSVCLACEARDTFEAEFAPKVHKSLSEQHIPNLVAGSMSCHPPGMAHGNNMDMGKWPAPEIENEGYLEQGRLLRDAGADVIFVEMVWEWKEHGVKAVQAAVASGLPVVVNLAVFNAKSCEEGMPQLHDGTSVEEVARELASGDDWTNVVGICVHHTKLPLVLPCLMAIRQGGWEGVVGAYPDHGTFQMPHWRFEALEADKIVNYISEWVAKARCQIVGGCCGIGPETIVLISKWCQTFNSGKGICC